jgi:hypothetical protein
MRLFGWRQIGLVLSIVWTGGAAAADVTSLQGGAFVWASKKDRMEIARDLKGSGLKLSSYLPNLKPSEIEWVRREREEIARLGKTDVDASNSRMRQLFSSPEFQQIRLQETLGELSAALDCVTNATSSLSKEMFCWSVASFHLTGSSIFQDAISILLRAGRLPDEVKNKAHLGPEDLGFGVIYGWWGRGIHEYILIPYLRQQSK